MSLPEIFLTVTTMSLIGLLFFSHNKVKWIILIILTISFGITTTHNYRFNPHYQVWMCNFTALFGIILAFKFHQRLFETFFYFAWTGDVFTFFVPDNQTLPAIDSYPVVWVAYWLKHITPLVLSVFLILREKKRLSEKAMNFAFAVMTAYAAAMFIYNLTFDQNILDLIYPTVDIQNLFGDWPLYIFVDFLILFMWYLLIRSITRKIGITRRVSALSEG